MFVEFLSLVGLLIVLYKIWWYRYAKYIDKIPGPPVSFLSIAGNIPEFFLPLDQMWLQSRETTKKYYPIYRLWSFEESYVCVFHPDDIEALLSAPQHITKSTVYKALHPWLESGLLTSTGAKWRNRRKILTPAFHFNVLRQFTEIFEVQAKQLVNSVRNSGQDIFNVAPLIEKFTLNTICETAMGTHLDDNDNSGEKFRTAIHYMGSMVFIRIISPWMNLKWFFKLLPSGRKQASALKILHDFSTKMIEERKKYHEEHNVTDIETLASDEGRSNIYDVDEKMPKKKIALLDLLITVWKRGGIDNIGIREEVDTFTFEGHDTTASGLTFTVLLLAEHQEIQERARREVDEMFEQCNGKPQMQELQGLSYTERCIKEALRLYPPVPLIARLLTQDAKFGGYLVPKGTTVAVHVYDIHRDPNFWPNPTEYNPDRFLPEKINKRHPYSYIPFSAGPRNCIGQRFAMLELKSAVAHLLHNFHMEAIDKASDARLLQDIIMRCNHPLRVKFSPIDRQN